MWHYNDTSTGLPEQACASCHYTLNVDASPLPPTATAPHCAMPSRPCPGGVAETLDANAGQYLVKVVKRPFGMRVQHHGPPRVVDVQPRSAAAETGVRCGWVVTAIDNLAVDSSTWLDAFTNALVPFIVKFDTTAARVPEPLPAAGPPLGERVLGDDGASGRSRAWPQAPAPARASIRSLSYRCATTGCLLRLPQPPRAALAPAEPRSSRVARWIAAGTVVEDGVFQGEIGDRLLVGELLRLLDAPAAEITAEQRLVAELWGTG